MILVRNEGFLDRALRIVGGLGFLWLVIVGPVPSWGLVGGAGLILLVTRITGSCPTYRLFNIDTHSGRLHPPGLRRLRAPVALLSHRGRT